MAASARRLGALRALVSALRSSRRPGEPGLAEHLRAVPRMVSATLGGSYRGLTRGRLGLLALAALYVLSPVDVVPEAVFLLAGLADDALVVTWLAGTVLEETRAFLRWEAAQPAGTRRRPGRGTGAPAGNGGHETVEGEVVV